MPTFSYDLLSWVVRTIDLGFDRMNYFHGWQDRLLKLEIHNKIPRGAFGWSIHISPRHAQRISIFGSLPGSKKRAEIPEKGYVLFDSAAVSHS